MSSPGPPYSPDLAFLSGGGEMGALMRAHDWSATAIGPPENWPQSLRTAVRLLLNTGHPMYIFWGSEGACIYNDAYRQSIGPERHPSSLGRPAREVWEEIWDTIGPQIDQVMAGRGATWHENALVPITRYGRLEQVYWTYSYGPIDEETAPNGVGGVLVVCTETTRATLVERALRESEEQLRLATEAAEVGLWDVDMITDTLFWPARVKAMFGISPDVPVSMADFYAGLHADDRERVTAAFAAALDPGQRALYDVEYRTVGKEDGLTRWVAAKGRGFFDEKDVCVRVLGTAIDITARKRSEERLRSLYETLERRVAEALAERKILADIVESTDALIQVVDLDYRWLAINSASANALERLTRVRPKAGDSMIDFLAQWPAHQQAMHVRWRRALAAEQFTTVEKLGDPAIDGAFYEMKFNTLRDRDGAIVGAYLFAYDITQRLHDQARLAHAQEQLRQSQKIEAIGQLTGGVAHDFNNLLMVISGGLSLLDKYTDPERRQRIIDGMRQAAERGASLSRQLLTFARRQPLNPLPLDIARHLNSMRELLDRTLRGDVLVEVGFAADVWPVKVDPAEFELALLNLCVNARDAMPQGGTITIGAENLAQFSNGELSGDFVRLTVDDSGTGMPKDVLDRVFEPFFTTKPIGQGSGLGLAQVYGFAKQSGGAAVVSSVVGRGTTVVLMLPRSEDSPASSRHGTSPDSQQSQRRTAGAVLLVEDDDQVASMVNEMLLELGYLVTRVSSAEGALRALDSGRACHIVFSDIMMPGGVNGVELAREIRRRYPTQAVLLTSGYSQAVKLEAAAEGIELLAKPYDLNDLAAALKRVLARDPQNRTR